MAHLRFNLFCRDSMVVLTNWYLLNQQQCADSGYIRNLRIITHRIFWVRFWTQKHTMSSPFPNCVTYLATKQGSIYIQLRKTKKGCLVPRRVAPMWYRTQNMFCCTQYYAWSSLTTQHHYIYMSLLCFQNHKRANYPLHRKTNKTINNTKNTSQGLKVC